MPPPDRSPPVPPGDNEVAQASYIDSVPSGCVSINSLLPNAQFFNLDEYGKDWKYSYNVNPDLLTDEETSTG